MCFLEKILWVLLVFPHDFKSFLHGVKPSWHGMTADLDSLFSSISLICGDFLV